MYFLAYIIPLFYAISGFALPAESLFAGKIFYFKGNIMFNSNSSVILHIINCNMFLFSIIRDAEHMQSSCTFSNCLFMLKHYTSVKRPNVNSMFLILKYLFKKSKCALLIMLFTCRDRSFFYISFSRFSLVHFFVLIIVIPVLSLCSSFPPNTISPLEKENK